MWVCGGGWEALGDIVGNKIKLQIKKIKNAVMALTDFQTMYTYFFISTWPNKHMRTSKPSCA